MVECRVVACSCRAVERGCSLAVLYICEGLGGFKAVVGLLALVGFWAVECVCMVL